MSPSPIHRHDIGPRMSEAVVHNGVVYLSGQVAESPGLDVAGQTRQALEQVDALLRAAGSSRERVLRAEILLSDINDFSEMNAVWDAWVLAGQTPARATFQAALADPDWKVEIIITAAL